MSRLTSRSKTLFLLFATLSVLLGTPVQSFADTPKIRHERSRERPNTGTYPGSPNDEICRAKAMEDRFDRLEIQMTQEMNALKTMVLNLEDKMSAMDIGIERSERRLLDAILKKTDSLTWRRAEPQSGLDWEEIVEDDSEIDENTFDSEAGPRDAEVQAQNHTVHAEYASRGSPTPTGCGNGRRVYNYYWRVRNMKYKMSHWPPQRSIRSPSFYIWPGGYRMYLRVFPKQSGDNVYVHVGLTRGDYDESLRWPFYLPLRLAVLDQSPTDNQDLKSRLWYPASLCSVFNWQRPSVNGPADNYECVGLGFQQDELRTRAYLTNDSLLVRLSVCIDAD